MGCWRPRILVFSVKTPTDQHRVPTDPDLEHHP
jgi:hypothetical protein